MNVTGFSKEEFKRIKHLLSPGYWSDKGGNNVISKVVNITEHLTNWSAESCLMLAVVFYQDPVSKKRMFMFTQYMANGCSSTCSFLLQDPLQMSARMGNWFNYYARIVCGMQPGELYKLITENVE